MKTVSVGTIAGLAGCSDQSEGEAAQDQNQTSTENTPSDENDNSAGDVIYTFGTGQITAVDPQSAEIVNEITDGLDDAGRGDALPSPDNRRLFVNDGANAQVLVIDTEQQ